MTEPVISAYRSLPEALRQWSNWVMDSGTAFCAGFPKRSVVAVIESLRLTEHGEIENKPGICLYCRTGNTVRDLPSHIRQRHPERYQESARGSASRASRYYSADDHPVAEAVEDAIVVIGRTRPELYHVIIADTLGLVPKYKTGWDQKRWSNMDHYQRVRWHEGDREEGYKKRLASEMGIGLSKFYRLREQAHTAIGLYLDLRRERYIIIPA